MKRTFFIESVFTTMLRLRAICPFSWRVFHFRPFSCEPLISQMDKCTNEEQVFDLIEKNKAILSEEQVGCAFSILWQFQKQKTSLLKSVECIRDHPQFLTLYNLTINKMEFMNDDNLVNVLYITQQFAIEAHDPLVEALMTEAWRRLERFDINVLSKFSSCLADQHLYFSPLMGKIADIVNRNLETIQDLRSLSVLMVSISSLISQRFQEQLVNKAELLFDTIDPSHVNIARRIVQFLRNIKYSYYPLLERCNKVFLSDVANLDLESISKILSLYNSLQFHSFDFILMAKRRLTKMVPLFDQPASFVKLFAALGPMAGPEEKKQLESTVLLMSEELTSQQALAVIVAMEEMESRNSRLIKKIASILHRNLDNYKSIELLKITQALIFLHFRDKIASVVLQQIEKIHPFAIFAIILPFSILNYDPPQRDAFFGTCIQHLNSYLSILDPLMLVFLGFYLATLQYFPEDLLKTIFNIKFLGRLDLQLELLCPSLNMKVQIRLMELNRAVCLECPEYQIPWFHDRFCQQHYNKDIGILNGAQQQIYKMLAEVLGGINCVKASVLTPYYHTVDFECILDKRKKPLPYGGHKIALGKLPEMHWESNTQIVESRLPPEAERIALEFLDLRAFCRNIPHLKGKSAMKKRHLEILGYRVIQIPHFEWNSMTMSTKDARMDYLRERIFGDGKS
ncbi:FAST kinase domain-containing protein 1, mitochondrial isoform X3 [Molossus molossus]|uniref:FAST kinase domain-containing protein 1, mitochondrial isoform X3 n=1 Tax=Molossus molossus TaxID=27622 RepID=UPI001745D68D|nr:FAST kinase domain-containing protein 1, mitochondrial isoform X3 [Molossus molossus]